MTVVENKICSVCNKPNTELISVRVGVLFWKQNILVCQTCTSKAFSSFRKGK